MSYFHERGLTIIGAEAFHGPVRDGKGWFHHAMVVRHDLLTTRFHRAVQSGKKSGDRSGNAHHCDCRNRDLKDAVLHLYNKTIGSSLTGN